MEILNVFRIQEGRYPIFAVPMLDYLMDVLLINSNEILTAFL